MVEITKMVQAQQDPIAALFDLEKAKDYKAYNANIDFDKRVQRQALPITRMITPEGQINKSAIANMIPFEDPYQMWENMNANMPGGRGIDSQVFQEKYQMGKQMYDMNLANQVNLLRQGGLSDKKIGQQFDDNLEMKQYMIENGLLQPTSDSSGKLNIAKNLALGGLAYGGVTGAGLLATTPKPNAATLKALKASGYNIKNGNLTRMGVKEIIATNKSGWDVPPDERPIMKTTGKPRKGSKPIAPENSRAWREQAQDIIESRRRTGTSRTARAALTSGNKQVKKAATNAVINNTARHVGTKIGTGILARTAGLLAGTNPIGLAANAALIGAPWLIDALTKDKDNKTVWK